MRWQNSAAAVCWNIQPFIGGRYRPSGAAEQFDKLNPATEELLYRIPVGDVSDVNEAVRVARARFEKGGWSDLPVLRRAQALLRLSDLIVRDKAQIALLDTLEIGKPIQAALHDAEHFATSFLRAAAGFADKLYGMSAATDGGSLSLNSYEPRGVVGLITPWNFPIVNAAIKLGPALAVGNVVVLKPSELSSGSSLKLAELALEAGIPEGVINVTPGLGSTVGAALASHPDVDLISFTGSTHTGRKVMEMAARSNGKPLLLECGGKCPHVVFEDVSDPERVAAAIVDGFVWNQGQVCSAHTRLIAHESIGRFIVERIVARASKYLPADPLDETTVFGPLASPAQRDRVARYIELGIKAGAIPVLRGSVQMSGGCNVAPTVFDSVGSEMVIAREEIFGPVLCVLSFQTEEQAVALANATQYGLAATVWTRDAGRGRRLARAIKAGHISVRTGGPEAEESGYSLSHEPQKASGFGSETGLRGLQCYSTLKHISFKGA
jgi:acyl-CoA reductase-like NAD-dependent aldehyde dehydrogenase